MQLYAVHGHCPAMHVLCQLPTLKVADHLQRRSKSPAGIREPLLPSNRIEATVRRPDIDCSVGGNGWRRLNQSTCLELPFEGALILRRVIGRLTRMPRIITRHGLHCRRSARSGHRRSARSGHRLIPASVAASTVNTCRHWFSGRVGIIASSIPSLRPQSCYFFCSLFSRSFSMRRRCSVAASS